MWKVNDSFQNCWNWFLSILFQFLVKSINPYRTGNLSLPSMSPSLILPSHSQTRPGISLCSLPILSLPGRGLFLVSWHNADTGLFHLILSCKSWIFYGSFTVHCTGALSVTEEDLKKKCMQFLQLINWIGLFADSGKIAPNLLTETIFNRPSVAKAILQSSPSLSSNIIQTLPILSRKS